MWIAQRAECYEGSACDTPTKVVMVYYLRLLIQVLVAKLYSVALCVDLIHLLEVFELNLKFGIGVKF